MHMCASAWAHRASLVISFPVIYCLVSHLPISPTREPFVHRCSFSPMLVTVPSHFREIYHTAVLKWLNWSNAPPAFLPSLCYRYLFPWSFPTKQSYLRIKKHRRSIFQRFCAPLWLSHCNPCWWLYVPACLPTTISQLFLPRILTRTCRRAAGGRLHWSLCYTACYFGATPKGSPSETRVSER